MNISDIFIFNVTVDASKKNGQVPSLQELFDDIFERTNGYYTFLLP